MLACFHLVVATFALEFALLVHNFVFLRFLDQFVKGLAFVKFQRENPHPLDHAEVSKARVAADDVRLDQRGK